MTIAIIGAGASGMMAALAAAETGAQVLLFERQSRVGRKLLATGNGRCNLSNIHTAPEKYHGEDADFVIPALTAFSQGDTMSFFEKLGLFTVTEDSGKVYPYSDQANSVVDVLRFALEQPNITLISGAEVSKVKKNGDKFLITAADLYEADKVIVACGGAAGGKLGGTDLGYMLLRSMGHTVTSLHPALVQLKTDTTSTRSLKGVRADAGLTLKRDGVTVLTNSGEVQFTDFGISGPAIFELSREAGYGGDLVLLLDLLQPMDENTLCQYLAQKRQAFPALLLEDLLTGTLHNRLGRVVLKQAGFELTRRADSLTDRELTRIAHEIKFFPLTVTGVMGLELAQVTAGGVLTSEFRPDTLESRLCPGLFATGEVLDIDGDCGGYNLQWAWSSGRVAGQLGNRR